MGINELHLQGCNQCFLVSILIPAHEDHLSVDPQVINVHTFNAETGCYCHHYIHKRKGRTRKPDSESEIKCL